MHVTSTPTPFGTKVLIVPTGSSITDVPMQKACEAAMIFTATGHCLKNRFGDSSSTVLEVLD